MKPVFNNRNWFAKRTVLTSLNENNSNIQFTEDDLILMHILMFLGFKHRYHATNDDFIDKIQAEVTRSLLEKVSLCSASNVK